MLILLHHRWKDYDKIFIARAKGKRKLLIVRLYLTLPPLSLCKLSSLLWEIWILLYTFIAKALFMVNLEMNQRDLKNWGPTVGYSLFKVPLYQPSRIWLNLVSSFCFFLDILPLSLFKCLVPESQTYFWAWIFIMVACLRLCSLPWSLLALFWGLVLMVCPKILNMSLRPYTA